MVSQERQEWRVPQAKSEGAASLRGASGGVDDGPDRDPRADRVLAYLADSLLWQRAGRSGTGWGRWLRLPIYAQYAARTLPKRMACQPAGKALQLGALWPATPGPGALLLVSECVLHRAAAERRTRLLSATLGIRADACSLAAAAGRCRAPPGCRRRPRVGSRHRMESQHDAAVAAACELANRESHARTGHKILARDGGFDRARGLAARRGGFAPA